MRIILVRHGETYDNRNNRIQGLKNNLINDNGRKQVIRLREDFLSKKIDVCYMSPLVRAVETAMILIGDRVLMIPDQRLVERDMGNYEGKNTNLYDSLKYWDYKKNISEDGVEPIQEIFNRCNNFLDYVKNKHSNNSTILIVSHGVPIRAIYYILKDSDLNSNLLEFDVKNCFYEEFEIK